MALVSSSKVLREEGWFLQRRLARLKRVVGRLNAHKTPGSDALVTECMHTTAPHRTPPEHVPVDPFDPRSPCEMTRSPLIRILGILPEIHKYTSQKSDAPGLWGAGALTKSWPIRSAKGRRGRKPACCSSVAGDCSSIPSGLNQGDTYH